MKVRGGEGGEWVEQGRLLNSGLLPSACPLSETELKITWQLSNLLNYLFTRQTCQCWGLGDQFLPLGAQAAVASRTGPWASLGVMPPPVGEGPRAGPGWGGISQGKCPGRRAVGTESHRHALKTESAFTVIILQPPTEGSTLAWGAGRALHVLCDLSEGRPLSGPQLPLL